MTQRNRPNHPVRTSSPPLGSIELEQHFPPSEYDLESAFCPRQAAGAQASHYAAISGLSPSLINIARLLGRSAARQSISGAQAEQTAPTAGLKVAPRTAASPSSPDLEVTNAAN
jgi:hypothetical protein